MATLRYPREVPPKGFWFIQRESQLKIDGESLDELTKRVVDHRQYKGYEPTDFATVRLEVERQICSRLGKFHCKPEGPDDKWVPMEAKSTVIKLGSVLAFSRAAFEWFTTGRETVTREKAQARADKCAACPINWPLTGCKCGKVMKLIQKAVPADKQFANLGVCMVCECSLPAKVWLPRNVIDASNAGRDLKFPQDGSCWQADPEG